MVSFQLQDIAVQLQSGTRLSQTLAQQLPQLAGAFGGVGAAVGVLAAVGIPALAFAFNNVRERGGQAAEALQDAMEKLRAEIANNEEEIRRLAMGFASLEQLTIFDNIVELRRQEEKLTSEIIALEEKRSSGFNRQVRIKSVLLESTRAEIAAQQELLDQVTLTANELERARDARGGMRGPDDVIAEMRASGRLGNVVPLDVIRYGPDGDKTTSGRRGGGTSPAERARREMEQRIEALVDGLKTERETIDTWYQESLTTLKSANAQQLEELGGFNEARLRLEREYQDRLGRIQDEGNRTRIGELGGFFGDMASALASGNDELLRISKLFAAAQALISTYEGAAKALTLPFPANLAAFAQVLATGLGAVSAIQSGSKGGRGAGGVAPATATSAPAAETADQRPRMQRSLTLVGDSFNRRQAMAIAEFMNEGTDDGLVIRGRR